MPNGWRTINSLVHKIRLHGRRGKGMAESSSRQKSRHAPQKEGGLKILCDLPPVWPRLVRPTNLMSRMDGKKTHTHKHTTGWTAAVVILFVLIRGLMLTIQAFSVSSFATTESSAIRRPIKCQSPSWSQREIRRSTGHFMVTTSYLVDQQDPNRDKTLARSDHPRTSEICWRRRQWCRFYCVKCILKPNRDQNRDKIIARSDHPWRSEIYRRQDDVFGYYVVCIMLYVSILNGSRTRRFVCFISSVISESELRATDRTTVCVHLLVVYRKSERT